METPLWCCTSNAFETSMNSENSFYITLPSNTYTKFNNTNSKFKIPLAETLRLSNEWEVGLTEIFIPNYIHNIFSPHNKIITHHSDPTSECNNKEIIIPEGQYRAIDFAHIVNQKIRKIKHTHSDGTKTPCNHFKLHYNPFSKKMFFWLKKGSDIEIPSKKLQNYLGLNRPNLVADHLIGSTIRYSSKPCDFENETVHLYVYTNIVKNSQIGNMFAPILRIVNIAEEHTNKADYIHRIYEKPQYHPLSFSNINEIEIKLCNTEGETVNFFQGNTIVALHFKLKTIKKTFLEKNSPLKSS